ncbi:MAG: VWA domain-containing protein [Clostridiales bacterium]|nr:VWA domain-containing protein [Clostridiales bacterium]
MSLLLPLGFLGLIGLAVLLLIYLIKPNYQNKLVSSTFVWRLSLKYQKKRMPISKLKNLLVLLLQILIIALCAFILAGPVILENVDDVDEVVIIIEASASMRATDEDKITRFDRAIEDAREVAAKTFDKGGRVSLIFADKDADYVMHRVTSESRFELYEELEKMADEDACTYGSADIDGAMNLANTIVGSVPNTKVVLYTSTKYDNHGSVDVRTMARDDGSEWNVAVLDLRAERTVENTYTFYVDLACYGRDMEVTLGLNLNKVNNTDSEQTYLLNTDPVKVGERIRLVGNRVTTVTIPTDVAVPDGREKPLPVFTFDDAMATVVVDDSLTDDNSFSLCSNIKPIMNIQYASTKANSFFAAVFMSLQSALQNKWTVNYQEVQLRQDMIGGMDFSKIKTTGYDIYVFEEGAIPQTLPTDGVVFFVNPQYLPLGTDFGTTSAVSTPRISLTAGVEHPITKNVSADNIEVTRYSSIKFYSDEYTPLLYCQGEPVLACKNTASSKTVAMSFSVNYSTVAMSYEFPRLMLNIANYYLPSTFDKSVYEVNDTVSLYARSSKLNVDGPDGISNEYSVFPQVLELTKRGIYTLTQKLISDETVVEKFFVRIPKRESNIVRTEDALKNQAEPLKRDPNVDDLCVYFAAVLVALLLAERFLQSRTMN